MNKILIKNPLIVATMDDERKEFSGGHILIENEPQISPLSDQEISRLLREAGVRAARRTVAKYRESLGIGSSSERRRAYRRMARRAQSIKH